MNSLDTLIKLFLGARHDWVVGSKYQQIVQPGVYAPSYRQQIFATRHNRFFAKRDIQTQLLEYLTA